MKLLVLLTLLSCLLIAEGHGSNINKFSKGRKNEAVYSAPEPVKTFNSAPEHMKFNSPPKPMKNVNSAPEPMKMVNSVPEHMKFNLPPKPMKNVNSAPEPMKMVNSAPEHMKFNSPPKPMKNVNSAPEPMKKVNSAPESMKMVNSAPEPMKKVNSAPELMKEDGFGAPYYPGLQEKDEAKEANPKPAISKDETMKNINPKGMESNHKQIKPKLTKEIKTEEYVPQRVEVKDEDRKLRQMYVADCYSPDGSWHEAGDKYYRECYQYICFDGQEYKTGNVQETCCWTEENHLYEHGVTYNDFCYSYICDYGYGIPTGANVTECCSDELGEWHVNGEIYSVFCEEWECWGGIATKTYNQVHDCCTDIDGIPHANHENFIYQCLAYQCINGWSMDMPVEVTECCSSSDGRWHRNYEMFDDMCVSYYCYDGISTKMLEPSMHCCNDTDGEWHAAGETYTWRCEAYLCRHGYSELLPNVVEECCASYDGQWYSNYEVYTEYCVDYQCYDGISYPLYWDGYSTSQNCCRDDDGQWHANGETYINYCQAFLCKDGYSIPSDTIVSECCLSSRGEWFRDGEYFSDQCSYYYCEGGFAYFEGYPAIECCKDIVGNWHQHQETYLIDCDAYLCINGTSIPTVPAVQECCSDLEGNWFMSGEIFTSNCITYECDLGTAVYISGQSCLNAPCSSSTVTIKEGTSGSIAVESPSTDYDNDLYCEWLLEAPEGKIIDISFERFELVDDRRCLNNSLEYFDIPSFESLRGKMCGNNVPSNILTLSNRVLIRFSSNNPNFGGFSFNYIAVDPTVDPISNSSSLPDPISNCPSLPDVVVEGSSGWLSIGENDYMNNLYCEWLLETPENTYMEISFPRFDLEGTTYCSFDYVVLLNTPPLSCLTEKLCGSDGLQSHVSSRSNHVLIIFKTDTSAVYGGFDLNYTAKAVSEIVPLCDDLQVRNAQPDGSDLTVWTSSLDVNKLDCVWLLMAPLHHVVQITFNQIEIGNCSGLASLDVEDEFYNRDQFCASEVLETYTSERNYVWLIFRTEWNWNGHGFSLQYTAIPEF